MAEFVGDCPRCNAKKMTFDAYWAKSIFTRYKWQHHYEVLCVCRSCYQSTVFYLSNSGKSDYKEVNRLGILNLSGALNRFMDYEGYVSVSDMATVPPPEHLPDKIERAFKEAARRNSVKCWNAAGAMFRLCIDLATRSLLPKGETEGLNKKVRRDLGLRLPWLIDHKILPEALRELSTCIKEDGNDAAHQGTLEKEDAEDLLDFVTALLERLYTDPERVRLAEKRRTDRRA